jgi:hypothetical protein
MLPAASPASSARRDERFCLLFFRVTLESGRSACVAILTILRAENCFAMGAYNFKPRFVPFIRNETKRHTIRAKRARPDKPGNTLHLFTGQRTKACRRIGRAICIKVEDIVISASHQVFVDGVELNASEKNALAYCDGFRAGGVPRAFELMMKFWEGRLPFHGDIVHWSKGLTR